MIINVDDNSKVGIRLDTFIKDNSDFSRTYTATLIEEGFVAVNNVIVEKTSYKTKLKTILYYNIFIRFNILI